MTGEAGDWLLSLQRSGCDGRALGVGPTLARLSSLLPNIEIVSHLFNIVANSV